MKRTPSHVLQNMIEDPASASVVAVGLYGDRALVLRNCEMIEGDRVQWFAYDATSGRTIPGTALDHESAKEIVAHLIKRYKMRVNTVAKRETNVSVT